MILVRFNVTFPGGTAIIISTLMLLEVESPTDPFGGSFSGLLAQTSVFAVIILLLLLAFSLLSWTIILRKWLTFRQISQKSQAFAAMFRKALA